MASFSRLNGGEFSLGRGTVRLWDAASSAQKIARQAHAGGGADGLSADGTLSFVGGRQHDSRVEATTGGENAHFQQPPSAGHPRPRRQHVVSRCSSTPPRISGRTIGRRVAQSRSDRIVHRVRVILGERSARVLWGGSLVRVWDASTGPELSRKRRRVVTGARFSADETRSSWIQRRRRSRLGTATGRRAGPTCTRPASGCDIRRPRRQLISGVRLNTHVWSAMPTIEEVAPPESHGGIRGEIAAMTSRASCDATARASGARATVPRFARQHHDGGVRDAILLRQTDGSASWGRGVARVGMPSRVRDSPSDARSLSSDSHRTIPRQARFGGGGGGAGRASGGCRGAAERTAGLALVWCASGIEIARHRTRVASKASVLFRRWRRVLSGVREDGIARVGTRPPPVSRLRIRDTKREYPRPMRGLHSLCPAWLSVDGDGRTCLAAGR